MTQLRTILAATAAVAALSAGTAFAQDYNGSTGGPGTTSTTLGTSSTSTTGDSTVAPFQNFTTTVQNQTVNTTTAPTTTSVTVTPTGMTAAQSGSLTVSGTGAQNQTVTSVLTQTFNPGPPPTVASSSTVTNPPVNVGSPTVTAVSASGFVGLLGAATAAQGGIYGSNLSTSGPVSSSGSVAATQNSMLVTTGGTTYSQYTGTATYDPATGAVTVSTPTLVNQTTTSAAGLTTTGTVTAATVTAATVNATAISTSGINMNGGRITNLGAGVANTDAVNVGQLNSAVNTINASISGLNSSVSSLQALVNNNRKRSDAGIATAVAMSGGVFLPNKKFNLTANIGGFRDEVAVSAQLGVLLSENIALNAGVATSLHSYGGTAYRGGLTFGF